MTTQKIMDVEVSQSHIDAILASFTAGDSVNHVAFCLDYKYDVGIVNDVIRMRLNELTAQSKLCSTLLASPATNEVKHSYGMTAAFLRIELAASESEGICRR